MTVVLKNPKFLIDEVAKLGVTLTDQVTYDPQVALVKMHAQFNGEESPFGAEDTEFDAEFGSFLRHIVGRKADRAIDKVAKKVAPVLAIASFVIPGAGVLVGGGALAALAAADKLLGDPKMKNSAKIVSNTKAMAALGDPAAKRGVMVLAAAAKVRAAKGTPPGKRAIPYAGPIDTMKYTQVTPHAQVKQIARGKVSSVVAKRSLWARFKTFLHIGPKISVKTRAAPTSIPHVAKPKAA